MWYLFLCVSFLALFQHADTAPRHRLISLELASKGLHTEYTPLAVGELGDEVWQGVRNKYWTFETYFLPEVRHEAQLESVAEGEGEGEEE